MSKLWTVIQLFYAPLFLLYLMKLKNDKMKNCIFNVMYKKKLADFDYVEPCILL